MQIILWSLDPTHYDFEQLVIRRAAMANYRIAETPSKGNDVG
jgi:hypothetical protein